ncbi:hypothetical protein NPIL_504591, partial [Nephila pilipes]
AQQQCQFRHLPAKVLRGPASQMLHVPSALAKKRCLAKLQGVSVVFFAMVRRFGYSVLSGIYILQADSDAIGFGRQLYWRLLAMEERR